MDIPVKIARKQAILQQLAQVEEGDKVQVNIQTGDMTITNPGGELKLELQIPENSEWTPDPPQDKNSKRDTNQSRRFDQTQLRSQGYGYSVHRDYAAHFFRWGWAARLMKPGCTILDVGCGQDIPLARVLASKPSGSQPSLYVGCDYNRVNVPNWQWLRVLHDEFDFTSRWKELLARTKVWRDERWQELEDKQQDNTEISDNDFRFHYAVNFEVIEHMHTCDGLKLLQAIFQCLRPGGTLFLSTPVFNGRAAANHIHEYEIPELQGFIEQAGFTVEKRYGTFASYNELKPHLSPDQRNTIEQLKEFYDGDVAACFFAPMFPDYSRNNVWLCKRPK